MHLSFLVSLLYKQQHYLYETFAIAKPKKYNRIKAEKEADKERIRTELEQHSNVDKTASEEEKKDFKNRLKRFFRSSPVNGTRGCIDTLYSGNTCCDHSHFDNTSVKFSTSVLEIHLRKLYDGFNTGIEATAWREVLRIMNEGGKGLTCAKEPPTHIGILSSNKTL